METATAPGRTAAPRRPWRLSRRARKATLVVHVLAAGVWIGVDVIVAVLVVAGWFAGDTMVRGVAYQALGIFVLWPMLTAGLVSLASGVLLGVGSNYGLVRYWWVAVKLVLNIVLCTLIVVLLRPGLDDLRAYGLDLTTGAAAADLDRSWLFFPPAVSLTTLSLATTLAVAKPWGRVRSRSRRDR